ncbi:Elongation of very long chain fatty acids protein 1 [Halotydeus destructor]|nr:Elongation of very long chain fatty acids protein 1 [Halotydeus destructor]
MATGLEAVSSAVDYYVDMCQDPAAPSFVAGAPWKITGTVVAYLIFVLKVGPSMMRSRKPLNLDTIIRVYNLVNVLASALYVALGVYLTNWTTDCWSCLRAVDMDGPGWAKHTTMSLYLYLKIFDLLDTVFFVLRKKDSQVTTLHLVHHTIMPFTSYFCIKFVPYTPTILTAILNSFVHIIMYSYYFLSSFGPSVQKYLWWKSYITGLQMVQFAILLVHALTILSLADCQCSKSVSVLQFIECSYFLYGFSRFYITTYNKSKLKSN